MGKRRSTSRICHYPVPGIGMVSRTVPQDVCKWHVLGDHLGHGGNDKFCMEKCEHGRSIANTKARTSMEKPKAQGKGRNATLLRMPQVRSQ